MLPRVDDVAVALAEAIAIQQARENDTNDEEKAQEEGSNNWCQNPFCQKALQNFYASYFEERTCQQYRALRLQCVANSESVILREMSSFGQSDPFLVMETSSGVELRQNSRGTDVSEANTPIVIPRRKRPRSISVAQTTLKNESRSSHDSTPPQKTAAKFRRAVNVDILRGSSSRRKPRFGSRLHYEPPRVKAVPVLAVSSQMNVSKRASFAMDSNETGGKEVVYGAKSI